MRFGRTLIKSKALEQANRDRRWPGLDMKMTNIGGFR